MAPRRARLAALALGISSAAAQLAGCDPASPAPPAGPLASAPPPAPSAPAPARYVDVPEGALPPGGEVREHLIHHTLRQGQTVSFLAERYLKLTDYYAVEELEAAIFERNRLRRRAVLSVGQALAIAELRRAPPAAPPQPPEAAPGPEARAIYVTASTAGTGRVFDLVRTLKPLGLNAIVVDVKDSDGLVAYRTDVALAREIGADKQPLIADLPKLVGRLRDENQRVVARVAAFKDRRAARHAPRLALKQPNGDPYSEEEAGVVWLDPSNEEAQTYAIDLAREALARGFDEVQFDYVRFPVAGDVNRLRYEGRARGATKQQIITDFVARAARAVHDDGRLVSIDVFGTVVWGEEADVRRTGQSVRDLAPHVDVLCPMVYPSHFHPGFHGHRYPAWEPHYFVSEALKKMAEQAGEGGRKPPAMRPWLQAFPYKALGHFNAQYVVDQLRGARDAGGFGFQLWDAKNDYSVGARGLALWREETAPEGPAAPPEGTAGAPFAPPDGPAGAAPGRPPVAAKAADRASLR